MSRIVTKHPSRLVADISSYQNFNAKVYADEGHLAVILKATEGVTVQDGKYKEHLAKARHQGLRVGHYHFAHPETKRPVSQEVDNFLSTAGSHLANRDFIVLDVETGSQGNWRKFARAFRRQVKRRTGKSVVFYSYDSGIGSFLRLGRIWSAAYRSYLGRPVWLWQFTDGEYGPRPHTCAGIGKCDISRLNLVTWLRWRRTAKRSKK